MVTIQSTPSAKGKKENIYSTISSPNDLGFFLFENHPLNSASFNWMDTRVLTRMDWKRVIRRVLDCDESSLGIDRAERCCNHLRQREKGTSAN